MQISLEDIRAFTLVNDLAGFGRAADHLHLTQSALSRRIAKLEDHLGARLLERSTRSVRLTALGREFLPAAHRILREYERSLSAFEDVVARRSGTVAMASLMTVSFGVLPDVLRRFHDDHPGLRIRLLDDTGERIADKVRSGQAEFGVDMDHALHPELRFEPVIWDRYMIACHRSHPLAGDKPVRWSDLAGHRIVGLGEESGIGRQISNAVPDFPWTFEVQHLSSLLGFLTAAAGAGVVPMLAASGLLHPDLVLRPLIAPEMGRRIGLIFREKGELSPAAASLAAHVARELAAQGQADPAARLKKVSSS